MALSADIRRTRGGRDVQEVKGDALAFYPGEQRRRRSLSPEDTSDTLGGERPDLSPRASVAGADGLCMCLWNVSAWPSAWSLHGVPSHAGVGRGRSELCV